jgi:hypothetical protein
MNKKMSCWIICLGLLITGLLLCSCGVADLFPSPQSPLPTSSPIFTPTLDQSDQATSLPEKRVGIFRSDNFWIVLIILFLLLILALLLGWWILQRKKKPRPKLPLPTPPSVPTAPHLASTGTPGSPRRFDLQPDGITIGRVPENDLVITQEFHGWESTSRRHARVYQQAGNWIVEDLHSMNGIYVNGKRTGRNLLRDGWQLRIGEVEFIFHIGTGEEQR